MKDDRWWDRLDQFVMALFGAAIFAIVVAGTWDLATLQANSSKSASEESRKHDKDAEQQIAKSCVGADPATLAKCANEIVKATYENQRAEHDLVAQQAMARWALFMLYLTGGGLLVTGVGIYFVRENLLEMQETRKVNQAAVDAAMASNAIARQMGEAQVRAYLAPVAARLMVHGRGVDVIITVANSGQSPAMRVFVEGEANTWLHDWTHPSGLSTERSKAKTIAGYGGDIPSSGTDIIVTPIDNIAFPKLYETVKKGATTQVSMMLRWNDVFGSTRTLDFSAQQIEQLASKVIDGVECKAAAMKITFYQYRKQDFDHSAPA